MKCTHILSIYLYQERPKGIIVCVPNPCLLAQPSHPPPPPGTGFKEASRRGWAQIARGQASVRVEGGGCLAARSGVSLVEAGAFLDLFTGALMDQHAWNVAMWWDFFDCRPSCVGGRPCSWYHEKERFVEEAAWHGLQVYRCTAKSAVPCLKLFAKVPELLGCPDSIGGVPFDSITCFLLVDCLLCGR